MIARGATDLTPARDLSRPPPAHARQLWRRSPAVAACERGLTAAPREGGSVTEVGTGTLPRHRFGESLGRTPRGEAAARQALIGCDSTMVYL